MTEPLLQINGLTLDVHDHENPRRILHGVDLTVRAGESVGLVGESGSGKSMTVRSVIRLLPPGCRTGGTIRLGVRDVAALSGGDLRRLRGTRVAMIFQDPRAHINPLHTIGDFLVENQIRVARTPAADAAARARQLLLDVGITDPERRMRQRPGELSGGLLQRVMIAGALLQEPELLLADEPTTALDVTTQEEVMAVLDELRRDRGLGMLFISHDLDLAGAVCDRIAVMKDGRVVEEQPAAQLRSAAAHPYTRILLQARPTEPAPALPAPAASAPDLLRLDGLRKVYRVRRAGGRGHEDLVAVEGATLNVPEGGSVAIVGTSGSGKSTLARMIVGLTQPTAGEIEFAGQPWPTGHRPGTRERRRRGGLIQMVFQDPYSSLDRRQTVADCLAEVLSVHRQGSRGSRQTRITELLEQVGLEARHAEARPRQLSGGQRQRVAIARALAAGPRLLVLDEAVAALDVSVQAQVLDLLARLRAELGIAYLYISHDLPVVQRVCDTVAVMNNGRIVESGPAAEVLEHPRAEYTQRLISSVPRDGWRPRRGRGADY